MGTISIVLSLIKAIPILERWFVALFRAYTDDMIARMKEENAEAIKKAIETGDQRPIETTIGSKKAGEATGVGEIVTKLPGVE